MIAAANVGGGQEHDKVDTLFTRAGKEIFVPVYDTVKQLEKANAKADTILKDLKSIQSKLGIKEPKK